MNSTTVTLTPTSAPRTGNDAHTPTPFRPKRGDIITSRINGKRWRVTRVCGSWFWCVNAAASHSYPRGYSCKQLLRNTARYWHGERPDGAPILHPEWVGVDADAALAAARNT